jgi:hypothetical protein
VLTIVRRTKERAPHPLVGILSDGGHPLGQGANGGVGLGWVLLRPNLWSAQQEVIGGEGYRWMLTHLLCPPPLLPFAKGKKDERR